MKDSLRFLVRLVLAVVMLMLARHMGGHAALVAMAAVPAVRKVGKKDIAVLPSAFIAHKDREGKYDKFEGFTKDYKTLIAKRARIIGENLIIDADRMLECMNVREAYVAYKQSTPGASMPKFVNLFIDSTVPDAWNKGTDNRPDRHPVFNGVRAMIEFVANPQKKLEDKNQKLLEAKVDPTDEKAVKEHNTAIRELKKNQILENWEKVFTDFQTKGFTDATLEGFVVVGLGKHQKNSAEMNAQGKEIYTTIRETITNIRLKVAGVSTMVPNSTAGNTSTANSPAADVKPTTVPQLTAKELLEQVANRKKGASKKAK